MIIKSGSLLYLFDFDGTLAGSSKWKNLLFNNINCYRSGAYLDPSKFDIRWSILTGRPRIDKFFISSFCKIKKLKPEKIFTTDTWFYNYTSDEDNYEDKCRFIKRILDGEIPMGFRPLTIDRVVYIDNDSKCAKYMNSRSANYRYIAMGVKDLFEQKIPLTMI
jgi:hypothetical protein